MALNPLRKYKFKHNFADTYDELCPDGYGIEDSTHYFLDCHRYTNIRVTRLDSVSDLIGANIRNFSTKKIVSLLLFGSKAFKYDVNKKRCTGHPEQKFIEIKELKESIKE